MPFNWNGDYIPSKADKTTDILGSKEIGGIGQLIYHPFRFASYDISYDGKDYCAYPVCKKGQEPTFPNDDTLTGRGILVSLCNLAKVIDSFENEIPKEQLIVRWCMENMHPYSIDFIHSELIENFDINTIDPCCGSGTFIIALIKNIVGNVNLYDLSDEQKESLKKKILSSVYGIDINPLSVLSARVGYYLALRPFGDVKDIEIPIYLGDSAITPTKEDVDGIACYKYSVSNNKKSFDVILPSRFVEQKNFGKIMASLQSAVKTNNSEILYEMITGKLSNSEKNSKDLITAIQSMSDDLIELHKNNWDGIWIRIATNFMLIARLQKFDLIVGNPPWVKWEHLPSTYAAKIKELCNVRHIFSTRGRFGGTQLNICALISNGYSLKKSHFYLPEYDKTNSLHRTISKLAKKASGLDDEIKIAKIQRELSKVYIELCATR